MRALVDVSSNPTEWFIDLQANSIGKSIAAIKGKVILLADGKPKENRIACLQSLSDRSKDLIIGFIENTLWGKRDSAEADLLVGVKDELITTFDDEESLKSLDEILEARSRGTKAGDSSIEFLRRAILPFAKISSKVEIFDKWGAGMLLNNNFLPLKELLALPDVEICMFTGIAKNDIESNLAFDIRSIEIETKFESVVKAARGESLNSSITRLHSYLIEGKDLHNRWIVFHLLENKSLIMSLPKGLVEFSPELMLEATSVDLKEDSYNVVNVRNQWQRYRPELPRKTSSWCGRVRF